jgi:Lar family restriction alleviation protein
MQIELKPCPFCGGKASLERAGDRNYSCIVACTECSCAIETCEEGLECGKKWNERAEVSHE